MNTIYTKQLVVGQKIFCSLYNGQYGIIIEIEGEQHPGECKTIWNGCGTMGGSAQLKIAFYDCIQPHFSIIPESLARGSIQWRIYDEIASNEEMAAAIKTVNDRETKRKHDAEQGEARREEVTEQIKKDYPYLTRYDCKGRFGHHSIGAKNLKKELTKAFPKTVFKVSSDSYSGGSSIGVKWTDGPTVKQVEEFSTKYCEGNFDGMDDSYTYDHSNVWPNVYGGAKYISENRDYTEAVYAKIAQELDIKLTLSEYGRPEFEERHKDREFWDKLRDTSF